MDNIFWTFSGNSIETLMDKIAGASLDLHIAMAGIDKLK